MDIRLPTAAREPEWFCPLTFSKEVLNFSFRQLRVIPQETIITLLALPVAFRRVVETVGAAVFTIKQSIHHDLWTLFGNGYFLMDGVLEWANRDIIDFMHIGYLRCDVFNTVFSVLAIIGELSLYLQSFTLPAPEDLHERPFYRIYEHSLKAHLLAEGGIEELVQKADIRYIRSGLYSEVERARFPHGIMPMNLLEVFNLGLGVAPPNINIAFSILREIYLEHHVNPLDSP